MSRWSFVKRFGRVTFTDFMNVSKTFCATVNSHHDGHLDVGVTLYKKIPSVLCMMPVSDEEKGLNEFMTRSNKEGELAVVDLENITKELFNEAVSVLLKIHLKGETNSLAYLECKGLQNRNLVFCVPSDFGEQVKETLLGSQIPSRMLFRVGDGSEELCCASYG